MRTFLIEKDLTAANIDMIKPSFIEFWEPYSVDDLQLDFSNVNKIDSKGLDFILFAELKADARSVKLFAKNLSPRLRQMFKITGLDKKVILGDNLRKSDLSVQGKAEPSKD